VIFRNSNQEDNDAICKLHVESFGNEEGPAIARLALEILNFKTKDPIYSFVIENNESILGHIVFSPVTIEGCEKTKAYILAPLAISSAHQKKGLGTKLISHGISKLKAQGVEVVFVFGDPNYYGRSGFKTERNIATPFKITYPPEAWMTWELKSGVLSNASGIAKCIPPLMLKEYW